MHGPSGDYILVWPCRISSLNSGLVSESACVSSSRYCSPCSASFAVGVAEPAPATLPLGEYRWDGVAGTFFYIDPQDDMFVICMLQSPTQRGRIESELKPLVYQALER